MSVSPFQWCVLKWKASHDWCIYSASMEQVVLKGTMVSTYKKIPTGFLPEIAKC